METYLSLVLLIIIFVENNTKNMKKKNYNYNRLIHLLKDVYQYIDYYILPFN